VQLDVNAAVTPPPASLTSPILLEPPVVKELKQNSRMRSVCNAQRS
jgi:hypothetical protein